MVKILHDEYGSQSKQKTEYRKCSWGPQERAESCPERLLLQLVTWSWQIWYFIEVKVRDHIVHVHSIDVSEFRYDGQLYTTSVR
jgi:hypothetical protein